MIKVDLPINKYTKETVYHSTSTAFSVLGGIYASMNKGVFSGSTDAFSIGLGLYADELKPGVYNQGNDQYTNSVFSGESYWQNMYAGDNITAGAFVFRLNSFIEGISGSSGIPEETKNRFIGEAKFLRALCYFYLVNLYGGVPIITNTDYRTTAFLPRNTESEVYDQIMVDLHEAKNSLKDDYLGPDMESSITDRYRANKTVVSALMARVFLYQQKWQQAADEASIVISDNRYQLETDLNRVFLLGSAEAIWQLQPVTVKYWYGDGNNTAEGNFFLSDMENQQFTVSSFLLSAFESDADKRKLLWLDTLSNGRIVPYKYKTRAGDPKQEGVMLFRLAEQYLIRAEAKAKLNDVSGAQNDLNIIRTRAGLTHTTANDETSLIEAILQERRLELFSEFGHRWMDLKRTGKLNDLMKVVYPIKNPQSPTWESFKALLPLSIEDLQKNANLVQNPGWPSR